MEVDHCGTLCTIKRVPLWTKKLLNVNSPLQIGGSVVDLSKLGDKSHFDWKHIPTNKRFAGCIRNLTINNIVSSSIIFKDQILV